MASKAAKHGVLQHGDSELGHTGYFPTTRNRSTNNVEMNRDLSPEMKRKGSSSHQSKAREGIEVRKDNEPRHPRSQGVKFVEPQQRPQASRASPNPGGRGASVPVFGDWNENPGQAGGYTVIFDKLQVEKKEGNIPSVDINASTSNRNTPSRVIKSSKVRAFRGSSGDAKGDKKLSTEHSSLHDRIIHSYTGNGNESSP